MLTLDQVRIEQGDFTLSVDCTITPGITAVIGPSGGGKSTLLSAIAGFVEPVRGRVLWDADVLTGKAPGARPVSMLFQDNNLFGHLTAAQNVGLAVRPSLKLSASEQAQVVDALRMVGLKDFVDRKPAALSGGQQSRVALARVVVSGKPIVLLDEPFAALGPALKADMLELVQERLADEGRAIVMVTHDPADARLIADQVVLVSDGEASSPRVTAEIFADPPVALREYLGGGVG